MKLQPHGRLSALLIGLTLAASSLAAPGLPAGYPDPLPRYGHIDDIHSGGVVINDRLYHLSDAVRVHTPAQSIAGRAELRKDREVGFRTQGDSREIVEIWLLPPGHPGPNYSE